MRGGQLFLIVGSVLAIVMGGVIYLFQINKLAQIAPELDRMIRRHTDRWRGVVPPLPDAALKVLEKDGSSHSSPDSSAKGRAPGTDRLIYSWIDESGVRHFTDTAPPQGARDVRVMTTPAVPAAPKQ